MFSEIRHSRKSMFHVDLIVLLILLRAKQPNQFSSGLSRVCTFGHHGHCRHCRLDRRPCSQALPIHVEHGQRKLSPRIEPTRMNRSAVHPTRAIAPRDNCNGGSWWKELGGRLTPSWWFVDWRLESTIVVEPPRFEGGYVCQLWAWGRRLPTNG